MKMTEKEIEVKIIISKNREIEQNTKKPYCLKQQQQLSLKAANISIDRCRTVL